MPHLRPLVRNLLGLLIVASCMAAAIVPMLGRVSAAPSNAPSASPGDIVIAAFRFSGSGGEGDEYIELFNRSCSTPVSVGGWTVNSSNGSGGVAAIYTFPSGTAIASGQYFLLAGPAYSGATAKDASYSPGIPSGTGGQPPGGVALFSNTNPTTPVDQAGFGVNGYYEANVLPALPANTDVSYARNLSTTGKYLDSNNNLADFTLEVPSVPRSSTQPGSNPAVCGTPTQTISGNAGIASAIMTVANLDGTSSTASADGSGAYSVTVPSNWTGTITPSKPGYTFSPPSVSFANLVNDPGPQNFTATFSPTATPIPQYGAVVINEVGWAGTGASAADKWIELYNTKSYPIDLSGWTLSDRYDYIGTGGVLTFTTAGSPDGKTQPIIPAKGFFVIADNTGVFQGLTPDYVDGNLSNLPSCSPIYCGDELLLRGSPDMYSALIDTANQSSYYWLAGNLNGRRSMERAGPSGPVPDTSSAWLTYIGSPAPPACPNHPNVHDRLGNPINGTPGCPNWSSIVTATPPPTSTRYKTPTPLPPTPFAHMVLNEILPRAGFDWNKDGTTDVLDEFVEIKNLGPISASVSGWRIDVISPGGGSSYTLPAATLTPGQRLVYFRSTSKLALWDSGGTVRLINSRGVIVDAYTYGPAEKADQSTCRIPDGRFWTFPCFPTPSDENTVTGSVPISPTELAPQSPPCLLADTVPLPFKLAECNGYGADIYDPTYLGGQFVSTATPTP